MSALARLRLHYQWQRLYTVFVTYRPILLYLYAGLSLGLRYTGANDHRVSLSTGIFALTLLPYGYALQPGRA